MSSIVALQTANV